MNEQPPMITGNLSAAEQQTTAFMDAICSRDFSVAEDLLAGSPKLDSNIQPSNPFSEALWDAYYESMSYTFQGSCYTDEYGLYRDVTITYLSIPALMEDLQPRAPLLLANAAVDCPETAYDGNGNYTQDFIYKTLAAEAEAMLHIKDYTVTRTLTLQITGKGGHHIIQNTPALMDLISGSMGGA